LINYGRHSINEEDIQAVVSVLKSDYLTQGLEVPRFEQAVAEYCGVQYGVAVNSATSALHIACLSLGVGKGDSVWTVATTFVASANCALYCGAMVDFIDIDPRTYNLNVEQLALKLEVAKREKKLPKVVIPVHLCGQSCDMEKIHDLSLQYGFKIIEDASHAIGGRFLGRPIGGCQYSDITVFSFHPVKIITTGEGGMAVTNNIDLAKRLRIFRSHGITSSMQEMSARPSNEIWNYQQIDLGFNYRMTDLQAALGVSQMRRLDKFIRNRHAIAERYDAELAGLPLITPCQLDTCYSSYHLYVVRLDLTRTKVSQREFYSALHAQGIFVNLHYIPVYRQPYFEKMGFRAGYCPESERYFVEAVSLPIYSDMTSDQQGQVIDAIFHLIGP
jgi:UDP-4-amino-4,6-dideoxy-N-acetyl-beta-L-altrosamine transaminase